MDIENIKLKINEIQQKINEQEVKILNQQEPIPMLELDVQMMYIRILYDQYLTLRSFLMQNNDSKDNNPEESIQKEEKPLDNQLSIFDCKSNLSPKKQEKTEEIVEKVEEEEKVEKEEKEEETQAIEDDIIEIDLDNLEFVEEEDDDEIEDKSTVDSPYKENFFPQINPMIDDKEPEIAVPTTKEVLQKTGIPISSSNTVSDIYKKEATEINDQFSGKQESNVADKLQKTQTNDLMKAIDVNDKFLFIRELFNGNGSLFTEVVNTINEFPKITEAIEYFEEMKTKYRWKEESEAYKRMYALILKKYSNKL
ncbi:MAG TPA: hypothetical protein PK495_05700 [Bacteroidales bacterium]|nr:hypothetical protein [Bacteroidales bacterium]